MTNFILVVGLLLGLAGLAALGLTAFISWLSHNPAVWIAALAGASVAVYTTLKIRGIQDSKLVERYRQRQEHEPVTRTPRATKQTRTKPIPAQSNINIDDLCEGLARYGYSKNESRAVIQSILEESPDLPETEILTAAMHMMSGDLVK